MGRSKKTHDEDILNRDIGARLALIRAGKRWAQSDLAARLDMSPAHLNGLESGHFSFTAALLLKLARVLGVPVAALLGADPPEDDLAREWSRLFNALPRRDRMVLFDLARKLESWSQSFTLALQQKPTRSAGRLVALEGIDGVLLREVGEKLEKHMRGRADVTHCWYDHDSPLWQYMMRRLKQLHDPSPQNVLIRTLLFACERLDRQETAIRPSLALGRTVFTPFYTMAPSVYQEVEGVGDTRFIDILDALLLKPDVIIVVRSDPRIAARRAVPHLPGKDEFYSPYRMQELARAALLYERAIQEFTARGYQVRCVNVPSDTVTAELIEQLDRMASSAVSAGEA